VGQQNRAACPFEFRYSLKLLGEVAAQFIGVIMRIYSPEPALQFACVDGVHITRERRWM
jgi:hypothetical protein